MLAVEREQFCPGVHTLVDAIGRPVPVEEAVAGAVITMELVVLAEPLQLGLVLVDLLRAWRAVFVAEDADQRTRQIPGHVDRRYWRLGVELFLAHDDTAAPQIGAGVDVFLLAGIDVGVAAAGAGSDHADLAVVAGLRA